MTLCVLITGASRGIGLELARTYAARGDRVLATCRDPKRADELARLSGPNLRVLELDVLDEDSLLSSRRAVGSEPIHLVVHCAAMMGKPQRAPGIDFDQVENTLLVNTVGAVRVYDAFIDLLRTAKDYRKFVSLVPEAASLASFRAGGRLDYMMSKTALNALTRWVANTETEVLCVSMNPGWTKSQIGGVRAPQSPSQAAQRVAAAIDAVEPCHNGLFLDTDLKTLPF